jgi:hypothetical protein
MKVVTVSLAIAVLFCASAIAKDPNPADFPLHFKLISASVVEGQYTMVLAPGDGWIYEVLPQIGMGPWHTDVKAMPGAILPGRITKVLNSRFVHQEEVDLLVDGGKGKLKILRCPVNAKRTE